MVRGQQRSLPRVHRGFFGRIGVVIAENVEHTVHDEQGEFVVEGAVMDRRVCARVLGRVARGHRRTHEDVTQQQWHAQGEWLVVSGVERKRQHVGRSVFAHVLLVEHRDFLFVDEPQRQLCRTVDAFIEQHGSRQGDPTRGIDCYRLLVDGCDRQRTGFAAVMAGIGCDARHRAVAAAAFASSKRV